MMSHLLFMSHERLRSMNEIVECMFMLTQEGIILFQTRRRRDRRGTDTPPPRVGTLSEEVIASFGTRRRRRMVRAKDTVA